MKKRIPVERLEVIENKFGVSLNASAFLDFLTEEDDSTGEECIYEIQLEVSGEIIADVLNKDIDIVAVAYNTAGSIVATATALPPIYKDSFVGIANFQIQMFDLPLDEEELPTHVRVYPTSSD
jgi:hypothetical protein